VGAYRHQATWRSTTFNEGYADSGVAPDDPAVIVESKLNDQITIDELNIQRVSAQDYRELRQYLEGAEPNEAYEGVRAITGQGIIAATNLSTLEDKSWTLNEQFSTAACRLAAAALDPKGVLPFDFKRDTAAVGTTKALRFYCRPGPARPVWIGRRNEGYTRPWSFQLVAFDPFAYDVAETQTALGNLAGGANTVTNPGNIYTKPKIRVTFSGVGANPLTLTNTTTGQTMTFDFSGTAPNPPANGEVWILDVGRATMYRLSDGALRYGARLTGFLSNLYLLPGANNITWSSATGITSVRFDFRGAYA
jgi:hypothetical protein